MEFIKKNLKLLSMGAAALFSILALVCMAGAGVTNKLGSTRVSASVFECLKNGGKEGGACFGLALVLIFVILLILAAAGLLVLALLKKELGCEKWIMLACAGLSFVCMILFFATKGMISHGYTNSAHLGAGAIFAAIFCLFDTAAFGIAPVLGLLKK